MRKEGSIILMMKGMPWVVSPGPTTITVVASMKMMVVIMNTNMCPGEVNNDPLELQGRRKVEELSERSNGMKSARLTEVS
jgi:hypothetical protein